MADVEETGKIIGIIHRVLSLLLVVAFVVFFILGYHWLYLLPFLVIAVFLYFSASRFVVAIRNSNSRQTIFFIIVSVILLIFSAFYFYLLIEGLITGHFLNDSSYFLYPSPIVFLFQLFTVYVAFKVRSSIIGRTESLQLNA